MVWGRPRTGPRIDLGEGEARLVPRERPPLRWYTSDIDDRRDIVLRVAEDGTAERFTAGLRWERYHGPLQGLEEAPEDQAYFRIYHLLRRVRAAEGIDHFHAIFESPWDVLDPPSAYLVATASSVLPEAPTGREFGPSGEWRPSEKLRRLWRGRSESGYDLAIPAIEAEYLMAVLRKRGEQWRRAYGN